MFRKENKYWYIAPSVCALLIAVAGMKGVPWTAAALLLLPPAAATLAYTSGIVCCAFVCVTGAVTGALTLPAAALPVVLPWCALSGVIACVPLGGKRYRPLLWFAMCMAAWLGGGAILRGIFQTPAAYGLAQAACDWIERSPEETAILLNAYNAGLSRLTGTGELVTRLMGRIFIPDNVRLQLLYSLRVSLEGLLPSLLCTAVIFHSAVTALLCTLLPDWRRRRNGEKGELPSPENWYIPRGVGLAAASLGLGWVVAYMAGDGALYYLGMMCWTAFRAAYMLQGVCLLLWLEKKFGVRAFVRSFWAVVLSVLAPVIPMVMGMIDQRRDARHLRPDEEVE